MAFPTTPQVPSFSFGYLWMLNSLRVHVPNNWVLGIWIMVIIDLVLGKYMIIRYLDP